MNEEDTKIHNALMQEAYINPLLEKCAQHGLVIDNVEDLQAALHIIDRSNTLSAQAASKSGGFLKEAAARLDFELAARGLISAPVSDSADIVERVLASLSKE